MLRKKGIGVSNTRRQKEKKQVYTACNFTDNG